MPTKALRQSSEHERGEDVPGNWVKELRVRKRWTQKHDKRRGSRWGDYFKSMHWALDI